MILDFLTDEKSDKKITACLLSLASNHQSDRHLGNLPEQFCQRLPIKETWVSDIVISPDNKTVPDCPIYHNQMAFLTFNETVTYRILHQLTKQLETLAHRYDFDKPIVTLDVDIIAVKIEHTGWQVLARRLPLASYELEGLQQLVENVIVKVSDVNFLQSLRMINSTKF